MTHSYKNKNNKPLLMECHKYECAICCYINHGPIFGSDINICNNSNDKKGSYSNLGSCYTHPQYSFGSDEAETFLAGSYNFKTIEIEVYTKE